MSASYEFGILEGLSKQCYLTRHEHDRFRKQCARWKKEHPKSTTIDEKLYADILTNHILLQRLLDKRVFFDGSKTSYQIVEGRKEAEIDNEDSMRKAREMKEWYPVLMRIEGDLLKMALATKIEITNADFNLVDLIKEYQSETTGTNGEKATTNRCNGHCLS